MKEIYSVVDIGTHQVRVLIGQPDMQGRVRVLGAGTASSEGIDERGVANIERLVQSIQKALKQATQQSATIIQRVWVAISHAELQGEWTQAIVTFPQEEHEITLADLERLRYQAIHRPTPPNLELIHVIPQTYHLDHRRKVSDPLGMSGVRLEGQFYLVYAPQTYLNMLQRCFQRLGLEVEGFVSRALIAAEALLSPELKVSGVALVYFCANSTSVVVYDEGMLKHFAVLPLGSHLITQDIREALRFILPRHAEVLKIQEGIALASLVQEDEILRFRVVGGSEPLEVRKRFLAEVIQARLEEIFLFVAKEIEKAGLLRRLYGGIYLAGGGALMKGIESLVEYLFGERCFKVDLQPLLGPGLIEGINTPSMAGSVSLLYMIPVLKEFLPPLPPESKSLRPTQQSTSKNSIFQRIRSFLENNLRIPQELVE
ncbi:MAG: cell division protein FtsA [Bacteroidia bacterium]|nr:cell division protein FtsA [Bacteroidia bacterium]MDW8135064.1 cell division protein FtsA [Bacteroidia bacterium]